MSDGGYLSILGYKKYPVPHFPDDICSEGVKGTYYAVSVIVDQIEGDLENEPQRVDVQSYREHLEGALNTNSYMQNVSLQQIRLNSAVIEKCSENIAGLQDDIRNCREVVTPRNKILKHKCMAEMHKNKAEMDMSKTANLNLNALLAYTSQFKDRVECVSRKLELFAVSSSPSSSSSVSEPAPKPSSLTTRVIVYFNARHGEKLFIRGNRAGLTWDSGVEMKREGKNKWSFTTTQPFSKSLEFKFLRNDKTWEKGHNHHLEAGKKWTFRKLHF